MPQRPESFYETTLATALTAVANTISVTTAPAETSGFMVIEANTSNREIIKYTGVSGTTLTGVVRGLAESGSSEAAGTGKAHSAGVDIANRDVHYYYAQYYDFLTGASATGANAMRIGDGNTISASDRLWYVQTSSLSAYWGLNTNGNMIVSEDGVTEYVISAGGSGIAAGEATRIDAGVLSVDRLSTGGLALSADKLAIGVSSLMFRTSNSIGVDTTSAMGWSGTQDFTAANFSGSVAFTGGTTGVTIGTSALNAGETIDGTTTPVPVYLKRSDGELYKADANLEELQSGNVIGVVTNSTSDGSSATLVTDGFSSIASQTLTDTIASNIDQKFLTGGANVQSTSAATSFMAITFRAGANVGNLSSMLFKMTKGGSPTGNITLDIYAADSDGKPTGSSLGTSDAYNGASIGAGETSVTFTFSTPVEITPGQILVAVQDFSAITFSGGNFINRGVAAADGYSFVDEPTEKVFNSADSGSTWSGAGAVTTAFATYYTQEEYMIGDNIWLSETAGEIILPIPAAGVPLIKVGELMSQTLMKVDTSSKRNFLGKVDTAASGFATVNANIPPNTFEVVVDMANVSTRNSQGQIILRRNEIISQTILDDNGSGAVSIAASWTAKEGTINVTAGNAADVTFYFYSY